MINFTKLNTTNIIPPEKSTLYVTIDSCKNYIEQTGIVYDFLYPIVVATLTIMIIYLYITLKKEKLKNNKKHNKT